MSLATCFQDLIVQRLSELLAEAGLIDAAGNPVCNCDAGDGASTDCVCTLEDILGPASAQTEGFVLGVQNGEYAFIQQTGGTGNGITTWERSFDAACGARAGERSTCETAPDGAVITEIKTSSIGALPDNIRFSIIDCQLGTVIAGPFDSTLIYNTFPVVPNVPVSRPIAARIDDTFGGGEETVFTIEVCGTA